MTSGLRQFGPLVRLALARRPWIRWVVVVTTALAAGAVVHRTTESVDAARAAWGDERTVLVAAHDLAPGDTAEIERRVLPVAAIPPSALAIDDDRRLLRQHVAAGAIITETDVAAGDGPAATAEPGQVVVAVNDPLLVDATSSLTVGLRVQVHSEGLILADGATIVSVDGDVVFVALGADDAPVVSFAAQQRLASLAFER